MRVGRGFGKGAAAACLLALIAALALAGTVGAAPGAQAPSPTPAAEARVIVERAVVFAAPDRAAATLTFLFERERVPVLGQSADGRFVQVMVDASLIGWVLSAQVEISGAAPAVPPPGAATLQPSPTPIPSATEIPSATPSPSPSRTPRPTPTPGIIPSVTPSATFPPDFTPSPTVEVPPVLPGTPPPLTIALPEGWESLDLIVPLRTFVGEDRDVPLTIYFGALAEGVKGYIYLYWGFPNTLQPSGEYDLWADGVQILRGSLIGESCNLGVYAQQVFEIGGQQAVGAYYQAADCEDEDDTAGWFAALRVGEGSFAFYTAVEPWDALSTHRAALEAALASVEFQLDGD